MTKSPARFARSPALCFAACLVLTACAGLDPRPSSVGGPPSSSARASRVATAPMWPDPASAQLVVVVTPHWDAPEGRLARFSRTDDGRWTPVGNSIPVTVGREGSAWGLGVHPPQADGPQKREGDGRAPAGVFALGTAFGYGESPPTRMPWQTMTEADWCIDVPGSPLYNRIVNAREVGASAIEGSTEPMRRDLHKDGDQRYRLGFVIEHNTAALDRAGSCIFAHVWTAPGVPTAGCTAMADADMTALLQWLDPAKHPRFVLLPVQAYARLQSAWKLPMPESRDRHE